MRIEKFLDTSVEFHELDLLDKSGLEKLFEKVRRILGHGDNETLRLLVFNRFLSSF